MLNLRINPLVVVDMANVSRETFAKMNQKLDIAENGKESPRLQVRSRGLLWRDRGRRAKVHLDRPLAQLGLQFTRQT